MRSFARRLARVAFRAALAAPLAIGLDACSRTEPSYSEVVLQDQPASYWRFDDSDPSKPAHDEQGVADAKVQSGVGMRAVGAIAGDLGAAFSFDGIHGAVILPDLYGFQGTHPFTVEVWIAPAGGGPPIQRICNHRIGPSHTGWRLVRDQPQRVTFERWSGDVVLGAVSADIPSDIYSHVVARYDGAAVAIYVNGALRQSTPDAHPIAPFQTGLLWGAGGTGNLDFFLGTLDEAAIYDSALPPERIAAHHKAGVRK